jgi:polyhydroxyalkanoate synthase
MRGTYLPYDIDGTLFASIDAARRSIGMLLDTMGLGPCETPSRVVWAEPGVTLKGYGDAKTGPIVLMVPAPIKRSYIWDLCPHASVVQQCLRGGCRVYLTHWERPSTHEQSFGLEAYADRLIGACLDAVRAETGETRAMLARHSLGGTLAAIYAALHPERVQGLVLLGAPLNFGPDVGAFGPLVATSPPAQMITALLGNVPGSFLNVVS